VSQKERELEGERERWCVREIKGEGDSVPEREKGDGERR
jgi:hypothetical protein